MWPVLVVCAALLLGLLLLRRLVSFVQYSRNVRRQLANVPGPPPLPLLGNIFSILGKDASGLLYQLHEWHQKYGGLYVYWIGIEPIIVISDPEHLQKLCNYGRESQKSSEYNYLEPFIGNGLLLSSGDLWMARRRLLTPAFHLEILQRFVPVLHSHGKKLAEYLTPGQMSNFLPLASRVTLDALMESSVGVNLNTMQDPKNPFSHAIHCMNEIIIKRSFSMFLRNDFLYQFSSLHKEQKTSAKLIESFTKNVIAQCKMNRSETKESSLVGGMNKKKPLIDVLLDVAEDERANFDQSGVIDEARNFLFAGHDTTSVAISFTLFCLGKQPEVQERVLAEIASQVEGFPETEPTLRQLNSLEYLDRVIKESMRLFPPVPAIGKQFAQPVHLRNVEIPANTNIYLNLFSMHRNEEIYDKPKQFNPDRFLPDETKKRHVFSYLPFSAGPRNCIGQKFAMLELKLVLVHVLTHWVVESSQQESDLRVGLNATMCSLGGISLSFRPRSKGFMSPLH